MSSENGGKSELGLQPQLSPESRAKAIATKMRRSALINVKNLKTRRRKKGEYSTRNIAIQNFCRECVGFDADGMGSLAANVRALTALNNLPQGMGMGMGGEGFSSQTPEVWQASLILAGYSLLFIGLAFYLFRKRDLTG